MNTQPRSTGIVLMPAYGRVYATSEDMRKDWEAGKDFKLYLSQRYCSIRDTALLQESYATAMIMDPRSPSTYTIY